MTTTERGPRPVITGWHDFALAPENPEISPKTSFPRRSRLGLEGAWKVLGSVLPVLRALRSLQPLANLRLQLGLSQREMGAAVARVLGRPHPYGRDTVAQWESEDRLSVTSNRPRRRKYAAGADVLRAYRLLARETVDRLSGGHFKLAQTRTGIRLIAHCPRCARRFTLARDVPACGRCRRAAWPALPSSAELASMAVAL